MIIAPSILSFDFSKFNEQLSDLNRKTNWLHFDVMDGHFVPNLSFGPDILKSFRKCTSQYLDVHIMVDDPFHYADVFANSGADGITFHFEALNKDIDKCKELIKVIKSKYIKAGISIKPETNIKELIPLLEDVDLVLVMSVNPGFGGQHFIEDTYSKISSLNEYRYNNHLDFLIEVDGGINDRNANELAKKGADILVSGSYIFDGDIERNINKLEHSVK